MVKKIDWESLRGLSDRPWFTSPETKEVTGSDFLGLAAVNDRLITTLLPGLTNSTKHLRYYSMAAWTAWKFYQLASARGKTHVTRPEFLSFLELVESLFMVGNVLTKEQQEGPISIIGRMSFPKGTDTYPTRFAEYNRTDYTSVLAPAQYGPSLKSEKGLRVLRESPDGMIVITPEYGAPLAEEVEMNLRKSQYYDFFEEDTPGSFSGELAVDFCDKAFSLAGVQKSSTREQKLFIEALFRTNGDEGFINVISRPISLAFLLKAVEELGPVNLSEFDLFKTYGFDHEGRVINVPNELRPTQLVYQILMLRQFQKYAIESLLTSFEGFLIAGFGQTVEEFVGVACAASKEVANDFGIEFNDCEKTTLSDLVQAVTEKAGLSEASDLKRGVITERTRIRSNKSLAQNDHFSEFTLYAYIHETIKTGQYEKLLFAATSLLVLAAVRTLPWLESYMSDFYAPFIYLGGRTAISLPTVLEDFRQRMDLSLVNVFTFITSEYVISQHMLVVADRFDGKNRLRFALEESGFEAHVSWPHGPGWTEDRTVSSLSLLRDAGLVERNDNDEYYIPDGTRTRVERLIDDVMKWVQIEAACNGSEPRGK